MKYGHNYQQEIDPDYFAMSMDRTPAIKRIKRLIHGERFSRLYRPLKRITDNISLSLRAMAEDDQRL